MAMKQVFQNIFDRIDHARPWVLALVLAGIAFLLYSNTFDHEYALDDLIVITENPKVQDGLVEWSQYFQKARSQMVEDQYGYRPLTLISLALDVEFLGPGPANGHLMNVLYYCLVVVLVFFTLKKLFPQVRLLLPFLVTLLFVVHPTHVEAVANIKSRDEILALGFGLGALLLYLRWVQARKEWWWIPVAVALMGAAFLSKENAMTYLAVIPLAVLIQPNMSWREKLLPASLLPVLAGLAIGFAAWQGQQATVDNMALTEGAGIVMEDQLMGNALFQQHLPHERIATGTGILLRYWKNFLVPYPLVYYSGYNQVPLTNFGDPLVIGSLLFHLGLLLLGIWAFRKHPPLSFGIAYYFITISIYSHYVRPLADAMADRFLFSPSLGMALILVYTLMWLGKVKWKVRTPERKSSPQTAPQRLELFALPMLALLIAFAPLSWNRNKAWKDNLTLFSTDIPNLEECARCHFHYAEALGLSYERAPNKAQVQQDIIHHLSRAIEITDRAYNAYITLGRTYYNFGMLAQGNQIFEEATQFYPNEARPWFELGFGMYQQENWPQAARALEKACELAPNREDNFYYLAWSEHRQGNTTRGIQILEDLYQANPTQAVFSESLGDMYLASDQDSLGVLYLTRCLEVNPQNVNLYKKLYAHYAAEGDTLTAMQFKNLAIQRGLTR